MSVFAARPGARWVVPVLALAVPIASGWALSSARAQDGLEPVTAEQLLVDMQQARVETYQGTVRATLDLGLGALPSTGSGRTTEFAALTGGSHTLRVWADGPDRQRLALLGEGGEADVVRDGRSVWFWNAEKNTAQHLQLAPASAKERAAAERLHAKHQQRATPQQAPVTPQEAARKVLERLDPSTAVTTSGFATVAGRPARALRLDPRDGGTLVDDVVIDVDAETSLPLRVRVTPVGGGDPAIDVGFTTFSLERPDPSVFTFQPPRGAHVTTLAPDHGGVSGADGAHHAKGGRDGKPVQVGQGWSAVTVTTVPKGSPASAEGRAQAEQARRMVQALPVVRGDWGRGHVFEGPLFTMVLADDGRVAVGAVPTDRLEQALSTPAAKALAGRR